MLNPRNIAIAQEESNSKKIFWYIMYDLIIWVLMVYLFIVPIYYLCNDNIVIFDKYNYIIVPFLYIGISIIAYYKLYICYYLHNKYMSKEFV